MSAPGGPKSSSEGSPNKGEENTTTVEGYVKKNITHR